MSERSPKRIKMTESTDDGELSLAPSFPEFLLHPETYLPQPEFIENFYIEDDTALIMAIRGLNCLAVSRLLAAGSNPNVPSKKGVTPISAAAHKGDIDIIQLLLDEGANVNSVNTSGSTALIQASHFGHLKAVLLLLKHGSEADFANPKGTTALMRASQEGYVEITKVLIEADCDVNRKNLEGMNALMLASQRGHASVVVELIKAGASMDEQTTQGSTALMLACKRGHERVVEVLVSRGAEIYMRDCRARTARDTAIRRHHLKLLKYLNTQVQVRWISEHLRRERTDLLQTMRQAAIKHNLHFNKDSAVVDSVVSAIKHSPRGPDEEGVELSELVDIAETTAASYQTEAQSTEPCGHVARLIADGRTAEVCRNIALSLGRSYPTRATLPACMDPIRTCYNDWHWPILLMRCMHLPLGLCELIMDYLPTPRVWKWSLVRLKKRINLASHAATIDISIILDEMFTDMTLFRGSVQRVHLLTISKNESVQQSLTKDFRMHPALVEDLARWSDVQSLSFRANEMDVTFRSNIAKRYLGLAVGMYRLVKATSDPSHLFALTATSSRSPRGGAADTGRSEGVMRVDVSGGFSQSGDARQAVDSLQGMSTQSHSPPMQQGDIDPESAMVPSGLPVLLPGNPNGRDDRINASSARDGGGLAVNTVILEMEDDGLNEQEYNVQDHDTESELIAEADIGDDAMVQGSDDEN